MGERPSRPRTHDDRSPWIRRARSGDHAGSAPRGTTTRGFLPSEAETTIAPCLFSYASRYVGDQSGLRPYAAIRRAALLARINQSPPRQRRWPRDQIEAPPPENAIPPLSGAPAGSRAPAYGRDA